jgi:hypothetical protein
MHATRLLGMGILALAALIGPASTLVRADPLSKDDLRHSSWDTYYAVQGMQVHAIVTFNGQSGMYNVLDDNGNTIDTGALNGVHIDFNQATGAFVIAGDWSMDGQSGHYTFFSTSTDPPQFRGNWTNYNNRGLKGTWNGSYLP